MHKVFIQLLCLTNSEDRRRMWKNYIWDGFLAEFDRNIFFGRRISYQIIDTKFWQCMMQNKDHLSTFFGGMFKLSPLTPLEQQWTKLYYVQEYDGLLKWIFSFEFYDDNILTTSGPLLTVCIRLSIIFEDIFFHHDLHDESKGLLNKWGKTWSVVCSRKGANNYQSPIGRR